MDCSFISKSGDKTYGLAKFWNSKQAKAEKGLEISTLAVVDVDYPRDKHHQNALSIYRYYQARFQIEFLFRDAKQFTGLCDCQSRSKAALHNHFNASFSALNLIKWQDRELSPSHKLISIASWKRKFFNELFIERIFSNFALDLSLIKLSPAYEELCCFGGVAR